MLCSVWKKNLAVVFINKLDKEGKSTGETTGLCIECAKKQGIDPLANIMKEMQNMNAEDFEAMSSQFDSMMGSLDGSDELAGLDDPDDSKSNSLGNIFGNILPFGKNSKKDDSDDKKTDKKKKRHFVLQITLLHFSRMTAQKAAHVRRMEIHTLTTKR